MALLLDGPPSTISDLSARDFDLENIAVTEGIDLTTKLTLAASDITNKLDSMLRSTLPPYASIHSYAPAVKQVAVTLPLKQWHTYMTLRLIYQDLYYSRLNDRYQAKMKAFSVEEASALSDLRADGVGIVHDPLPQATAPVMSAVPSSAAGGTLYAVITYVNRRGEEGRASEPVEFDTAAGTSVSVRITAIAANAVGWNLYAGVSPQALAGQTSSVLDPLETVTLDPATLAAGPAPGVGQEANVLLPLPRRLYRG